MNIKLDCPNERTNLAADAKYATIKTEMAKRIPKKEAALRPEGTLDPVNADKPNLEGFKKQWIRLGMEK